MGLLAGTVSCVQTADDPSLWRCEPDRRRGIEEGLRKLRLLENTIQRAEDNLREAPRQLMQVMRAYIYFLFAVCHRHTSSQEVALQSCIGFLHFFTTRLYASSVIISWTELSSIPLFEREVPTLLCSLLDINQLLLVQTLFQTLKPFTLELDWMRTTFDYLVKAINHEYSARGVPVPPILSPPLSSSPTLPPLPSSPRRSSLDSSTLPYLPISSSSSSSSYSSPLSSAPPSSPSPSVPPSLATLLL